MSSAPGSERRARLGILLSGRGSNFVALAQGLARGAAPAEIAAVVSNVEGAAGVDRAREWGLPTFVIPHRDFATRRAHEARVSQVLLDAGVEWICLAGYMRLLSAEFVAEWPQRILNIHPSLLPSFPGLHPQRQAIEAGVRWSGCTVHLVDSGLDSGPIVEQRIVRVGSNDDEESLAARILVEEHRAYVGALAKLLSESWTIEGRRLRFASGSAAEKNLLQGVDKNLGPFL